MAKTVVPGKRIKLGTILLDHLAPGIKIPEHMLTLIYPTHSHPNKDVLERVRYTGLEESVDLRSIEVISLEIASARRNGLTLGNTIDTKANLVDFNLLKEEILNAKGEYLTLDESIKAYGALIEDKLNNHLGSVAHSSLDAMHADYMASKNGHSSLKDYLDNIVGEGVPGGGNFNINLLRPWYHEVVVTDSTNRIYKIPYNYTPFANAIEVFEGPLRMREGSNWDYVELEENEIEFNYDLPVGSIIVVTGVQAGAYFEWVQGFRANKNQRAFNLISNYTIGANEIVVYESGLLMKRNVDYIESSPTQINFAIDLPEGVEVVVYKRR